VLGVMKKSVLSAIFFLVSAIFAAPGWCIPPEISETLSQVDVGIMEIINSDDTQKIWRLRENPSVADVVYLKVPSSRLESELVGVLRVWLKRGNTLWLEEDPVWIGNAGCVSESFGLAPAKYELMKNPFLSILSEHPLSKEVHRIKLLLKIDDSLIFYRGLDEPVLGLGTNKVVMGVKNLGRGSVVTLPYRLSVNEYDGARLIANLKLWSVRNKIAVQKIRSKFKTLETDLIYWKNGDIVAARILTEKFAIALPYGKISINKDKVVSILFDVDKDGTDVMRLENGDRLSGQIELDEMEFYILESVDPAKRITAPTKDFAGIDIAPRM